MGDSDLRDASLDLTGEDWRALLAGVTALVERGHDRRRERRLPALTPAGKRRCRSLDGPVLNDECRLMLL